jgi:hypothetical protein
MGIVTDYLVTLISRQVDAAGIVVWYDPDRYYVEVAANLALPNTTIALYKGSFFSLRRQIEPLLEGMELPRLLVYVPLDSVETHNALIEVETAGVVMKPGQQPPIRNTRPSLIARNALKSVLPEKQLVSMEKQVEAGKDKLSLAELDKLADRGEEGMQGVVSLIFGTGNPQEVALAFLAGEQHDKELVQKGALPELMTLLHQVFDVDFPVGETVDACRDRLARHILTTDFLTSIKGAVPTSLATVKIAARPAAREACAVLARTWRLRRDLAGSYEAQANRVEKELSVSALDWQQEQVAGVETFLGVEKKLQECIERALLAHATDALVELALTRRSGFWSERLPETLAQWSLIVLAGQVLLEADRVEKELKPVEANAEAIFQAYTTGDHPWCLLDTYHRRMEHRYYDFGFQLHDRLEQVLSRARHRYMQVGSTLAETFLRAYQGQKFRMDAALRQVGIFEKKVKPSMAEGKVAYVWVDALRYEMGYELAQSLATDADMRVEAALGTVPTITEIGMAALLPVAQEPLSVVAAADGKLALEIGSVRVKDRKDRVNYLRSHAGAGVKMFEAKLEDLLPKPGKRVREGIESAHLVLITSQEIDAMGEEDNIALARRTMDEILRQLGKAFRVLGQLGVHTIIFTADHGHLFADELSSDMKIAAPGGDTKDLHRRVWVGHGGASDPSYLRARLSDFGLGGNLEIAVPWNFACFKAKGGAEAYFHGGMSPQELIIPVVTLTPRSSTAGTTGPIRWHLELGSRKISTRLCSVQITGRAAGLFELVPPKVRVEIQAGQQVISLPVSASYGFEEATGDVQLRQAEDDPQTIDANTISLLIADPVPKASVTIHLLDVISGVELARLDKIEMAIAL